MQFEKLLMVFHSSANVVENALESMKLSGAEDGNNILMQMLRCLHTRHGKLKTNEFVDETNQRLVESGTSAKLVGTSVRLVGDG